jgi:hypothetical protein
MKKWAALPAVGAGESRRVGDRAGVPAFGILAALLVGAVAGCHGSAPSDRQPAPAVVQKPALASPSSDRDAIEAVAKGFVKALNEGDVRGAEAFLTAKAKRYFAEHTMSNRSAGRMLGATYQLGEPAIKGDTADVSVSLREAGKEKKSGIKLRREGGQWGIFAQSIRLDEDDLDSEIVMNFEDPEATSKQYFTKLMGKTPEDWTKAIEEDSHRQTKNFVEGKPGPADLAVEALESITRDQFDASWKVDIHSKGRPAGEVLRDLGTLIHRSLETTPIQDRALARPVAIEVRGLSRLQAIDAVAGTAGLSPVYSAPEWSFDSSEANSVRATMRLRPRRGPSWTAFAGPFLVEVDDVKEAVPYATAILTVKLAASGLPAVALNDLESKRQHAFIVTDVLDAKGRSLVDTEAAASIGSSWVTPPAGEYAQSRRVPLKGLLRDVSAIKTLRCKLRVSLPARVEMIRFDRLVPGETRKAGDLEVTLKAAQKGQSSFNGTPFETWHFEMVFRHKTPDRAKSYSPDKTGRPVPETIGPDRVKFVGHDPQGRPLTTTSHYFQSGNLDWTSNFTIRGPATSLVAKVIADVDTLVYEFVLNDIPLASYASMPERIEPATFPGHESPVTVEVLPIGGNAGSANMMAGMARQPIGPGPQPAGGPGAAAAAQTEMKARMPGPSRGPGPSGGMGAAPGFQTTQLRVTNHSNKDIRMLRMKLDYLDPDGRRLGGLDRLDQWGRRSPNMSLAEANDILVAKGSQATLGISTAFVPQGTKTIAVTVLSVGFADAETWHAPDSPKKN